MAVVVPNNNTDVKVEQNWDRYRVSVNDIEKQTGCKFFDQVPAAVAQTLKSRVDSENIPPLPSPHGFTLHNYGEIPMQVKSTLARKVSGTLDWFAPNKGYGFIKLAGGGKVFVHVRTAQTYLKPGKKLIFNVVEGTDGRRFADNVKAQATGAEGAL